MNQANIDEGFFPSFDHTRLFYRIFTPDHPKKTLVILHGHGEHSGRYIKFFERLENENVRVAVFDFRGHGESGGPEVYVRHFQEYLDDVTSFFKFLHESQRGSEPVFLLGHSVGGLVAVHWTLAHADQISGLLLSSPCLGLKVPAWLLAVNSFLNLFMPGWVYQNPVYPAYLTHDAEEIRLYRHDKKIKRKMSVRLVAEMLSYMAKIEAMKVVRIPLPVAVLTAGVEKIVDKDKTHLFFNHLQAKSKEWIEFPGFYHEIFNESGQTEVFQRLKEILSRL